MWASPAAKAPEGGAACGLRGQKRLNMCSRLLWQACPLTRMSTLLLAATASSSCSRLGSPGGPAAAAAAAISARTCTIAGAGWSGLHSLLSDGAMQLLE